MAEINTVIAEASQDLQTIEDFVNLPAGSDVRPRLLPSVNVGTLAGARQAIFEAGGLPAKPFATKALMTESPLVDGDYAQVTDDAVNNGLYLKTAGAWVKSAYDPVVLANAYTDVKKNDAKSEVLAEVFNKVTLEVTRNLFDGNYVKGGIRTSASFSGYGQWVARPNSYTGNNVAIVGINGGETYSIKAHSGSLTGDFRVITYKEKPEIVPDLTINSERGGLLFESSSVRECTVTVPDDAAYLLIMPTINGSQPKLQVEIGTKHTPYTEGSIVTNTKPIGSNDIAFLGLNAPNIFDGKYIDRILFSGPDGLGMIYNFANNKGKLAQIKVKANTTYTLSSIDGHMFSSLRIGLVNQEPIYSTVVTRHMVDDVVLKESTYTAPVTFTTGNKTEYALIYVSSSGLEPRIQLEEGSSATEFKPSMVINDNYLPQIKTKRSKNLFTGEYKSGKLDWVYASELDATNDIKSYYIAENSTNSGGLYTVIPVQSGTDYTLTFHDDIPINKLIISSWAEKPEIQATAVVTGETIEGGFGLLLSDDNLSNSITFKTPIDSNFIVVQVGEQNRARKLQVELGSEPTSYKQPYVIPFESLEVVSESDLDGIKLSPKREYNLIGDIYSLFTLDTPLDDYHTDPMSITSAEQIALYDALASRHPDFFIRKIIGTDDYGYTMYSYETMPPKHYITPGQALDINDPNIKELDKPKIVLTSGVHGTERSAVFATYFFFKEMLDNPRNDKTLNLLKRNVKFVVAPINNNSGFDDATYETRNGGNINRDFPIRGKATLTETQNLISFFMKNRDMDYYFDFHNSRGASGVLGYVLTDIPTLKKGGVVMYQELGNHWQNNHPTMPQDPYKLWGFSMDLINGTCAKYCQDVLGIRSVIFETRYVMQGFDGPSNIHHEENVRLGVECITNMVLCCLRDST